MLASSFPRFVPTALRCVLFLLLLLLAAQPQFANAHSRWNCPGAFHRNVTVQLGIPNVTDAKADRARAIAFPSDRPDPGHYLRLLRKAKRLLYTGRHSYFPDSSFIASNERNTADPFLQKLSIDAFIAFGTNSSWELAANGNAQNLVIADWGPDPILAHAYLIEPLLRISKTPVEWLQNLRAEIPNAAGYDIRKHLSSKFGQARSLYLNPEKVEAYLEYLSGRSEITITELEFIAAYFYSRTSRQAISFLSPFRLRNFWLTDVLAMLGTRYSDYPAVNAGTSVLHNPILFDRLKKLYARDGGVSYALMDFRDLDGYRSIVSKYESTRRWTLSMTNLFDMDYAPVADRKGLMREIARAMSANSARPLNVFRSRREDDAGWRSEAAYKAQVDPDNAESVNWESSPELVYRP